MQHEEKEYFKNSIFSKTDHKLKKKKREMDTKSPKKEMRKSDVEKVEIVDSVRFFS